MIDIVFETHRFNLSDPTENGFGQDLLEWMVPKLELHGAKAGNKCQQTWGWEMEVVHSDTIYLVSARGTRVENSEIPNQRSWRITVTKRRSILDRALGKNRMSKTDPLLWMIESGLHSEGDFTNVRREVSAA